MAASLFEAGDITTTVPKAKVLRPYAERLITKAKRGGVHERRQVIAKIHDQDVTHKLFAEIGPRYRDRRVATCASSSSARAPVTTRPWRASNWSRSVSLVDPVDAGVGPLRRRRGLD